MARKRSKSGSKKKRSKGREGRVGRIADRNEGRYFTKPRSTEEILGELGVSREEIDGYLEAISEYAPDLSIEEALWTCDLMTGSKDYLKKKSGDVSDDVLDRYQEFYNKNRQLITDRFKPDDNKAAQAIWLFQKFPEDKRLSGSNTEPLDVLKVTLAANELKRRRAGDLIKPEDVEWADAVEFPDLDAAFKEGISPQEVSKEAADIVGHQCGLRFGTQEGDLTKDEEEYLTRVSDYLVCRFKAESMVAQVRLRIDEATGMVSALESEVADLKTRLRKVTKMRGEISDELSDEEMGNLIDVVRRDAPGVTIEDIAWMADAGSAFTDPEKLSMEMLDRFKDRENGQTLIDAAARMISLGRQGKGFSEAFRDEILKKDIASEHLSIDLTVFLTTEECATLTAELSAIGLAIIESMEKAGFKSTGNAAKRYQDDIKKVVVPYLESKREAREYPHLSIHQKQTVVDYCTSFLQSFINDATKHADNIMRIVQTLQSDEFELLAYVYADPHGGDFLAKIAKWYEGSEEGELKALFQIAEDFKAAAGFFLINTVVEMGRSFMPTAPSRAPGRAAVRHYLRCLAESFDRANEDETNHSARLIWAALRNARVFEVSSETFEAIFKEVQRYIWTAVAGLDGDRLRSTEDNVEAAVSEEELAKAHEAMCEAAKRLPVFDDIMPFDHIFVGFDGEGQIVDTKSVREKLVEQPEKIIHTRILGYLIGPVHYDKVEVIEFVRVTSPGNLDNVVAIAERLAPPPDVNGVESHGEWMHPWHHTPWIVNALLSFIHEHKTLVIEQHMSKKLKRSVTKQTKAHGFDIIPRPYYLVPLKNITVKDAARRSVGLVGRRAPLSYRHDRRGHERVFIQRGPLPLEDKKRKALEKKTGTPPVGYKVFTVENLDAESARFMMERKLPPKRVDEWVAVKVRYIGQQVIGDNSLPYVPAVRVSTDRDALSRTISNVPRLGVGSDHVA